MAEAELRQPLRVAHLTTVDMSLALLLPTELPVDVAAGFETYGISAPGPWVEQVEALGVAHVPIPSFGRSWGVRSDLRAAWELRGALTDLDLDVLHTHTPKAGVLGRVLGRLLGIPVVVNTCHGLWAQRGDPIARQAFVLGTETIAGRCSHGELYQNDEDRLRLRRLVGAHRQRTVGNGVDLDRFAFDDDAREQVRSELGVAEDEVLVGGVGRRVAEKGIAEFGAAARALTHRARFVWVGPDDPDKPDHLRKAEDGIDFLGLRHDMPAVYSALDVFVLPSHREGFSRSGMEAAAGRCALVLSDIRGCRELGDAGNELVLVPPGDAPALTRQLADLLPDAERRARLANAAQTRARQAFDQRRIAAASLATYRAVASRRGHWHVATAVPAEVASQGEAAA